MSENTANAGQLHDEDELKTSLNRIENSTMEQKPTENTVNADVLKPFSCPDFVLDFLQDKPIALQKIVITSKLSQAQKKEVEYIFSPNEHELEINRAALKVLIEKLAVKYPELQPWLTNEAIFMGTFAFGFYDRSEQVKAHLESTRGKMSEVSSGR